MLKVFVTGDVKGDVCVEQTEGENMYLLVAILASNVCFITSAAELIL
jgi:hypothetical protein